MSGTPTPRRARRAFSSWQTHARALGHARGDTTHPSPQTASWQGKKRAQHTGGTKGVDELKEWSEASESWLGADDDPRRREEDEAVARLHPEGVRYRRQQRATPGVEKAGEEGGRLPSTGLDAATPERRSIGGSGWQRGPSASPLAADASASTLPPVRTRSRNSSVRALSRQDTRGSVGMWEPHDPPTSPTFRRRPFSRSESLSPGPRDRPQPPLVRRSQTQTHIRHVSPWGSAARADGARARHSHGSDSDGSSSAAGRRSSEYDDTFEPYESPHRISAAHRTSAVRESSQAPAGQAAGAWAGREEQ